MSKKLRGKARARNSKKKNRIRKTKDKQRLKALSNKILKYYAPELHRISKTIIEGEDLSFIDELKKVLSAHSNGVGLSAPQIGINKRVIIFDAQKSGKYKIMINPEIIEMSEENKIDSEGCLSYPNFYTLIERAKNIKVKYLTKDFKECIDNYVDFEARIVQHEIDHLFGECLVGDAWEKKQERRSNLL
ncbi:MAG: peptide deformylase [Atribacterota bacterium]